MSSSSTTTEQQQQQQQEQEEHIVCDFLFDDTPDHHQKTSSTTTTTEETKRSFSRILTPKQKSTLYHLTQVALDFFKELDVPVWASSGTVLGALRHQEIIPWDDDVDLCVPKCSITKYLIANSKAIATHRHLASAKREKEQNSLHEEIFDDDNDGRKAPLRHHHHHDRQEPNAKIDAALKKLQASAIHARIAHADRVGLRFFDLHSEDEEFPFVDVFVMQKVQNFATLQKKYPRLARKIDDFYSAKNEEAATENDESRQEGSSSSYEKRSYFVIDDPVGCANFPDEVWFADTVLPASSSLTLHPFGPIQIPISCDAKDYLSRNYGDDWRTVAQTHTIDHKTKAISHEVSKVNLVDAMKMVDQNSAY